MGSAVVVDIDVVVVIAAVVFIADVVGGTALVVRTSAVVGTGIVFGTAVVVGIVDDVVRIMGDTVLCNASDKSPTCIFGLGRSGLCLQILTRTNISLWRLDRPTS